MKQNKQMDAGVKEGKKIVVSNVEAREYSTMKEKERGLDKNERNLRVTMIYQEE